MIKKIFSFKGRISRTEYIVSYFLYLACYFLYLAFYNLLLEFVHSIISFSLLNILLFWFIASQSAKRCHDIGKSGWWQLIPFYFFWLLFKKGQSGENKYGKAPWVDPSKLFINNFNYNVVPEATTKQVIMDTYEEEEDNEYKVKKSDDSNSNTFHRLKDNETNLFVKEKQLIKKRLSLSNYLKKLSLIVAVFFISVLFQHFIIGYFEANHLMHTTDFESIKWFHYYSLFHYNILPILLIIWLIVLSIFRLQDSNLAGVALIIPGYNLIKLFSYGDANENKYGPPQNFTLHKTSTYFDEIGKNKTHNIENPLKPALVFAILVVSTISFFYFNNSKSITYSQLVTEYEIINKNNPIFNLIKIPGVNLSPIKNSKLNGIIKSLAFNDNFEGNIFYVFDKAGKVIRKVSNTEERIFYYNGVRLDSIIEKGEGVTITKFHYKTISDTNSISLTESYNNEIFDTTVLQITKKEAKTVKSEFVDSKVYHLKTQIIHFNNFKNVTKEIIKREWPENPELDEELVYNYDYDLNNNLIRKYGGSINDIDEYSYINNNRLLEYKYFLDADDELPIRIFKYSYSLKTPSINYIDYDNDKVYDFLTTHDSTVYNLKVRDTNKSYSLTLDKKNNIIEVPENELPNFLDMEQETRKYTYYNTYFDFFKDLFSTNKKSNIDI